MAVRLAVLIFVGATAACSSPPGDDTAPTPVSAENSPALWDSRTDTAFDYQLGGAYPPPPGTAVVVRDSTDLPLAGLYNVCYVNGFQTQPDERDRWTGEYRDLVLKGPGGRPLVDEGWPDELILDTSTADRRRRIAEAVGSTIEECARKGFRAVEIDNLDSFTRSRGLLTAEDNLALAALLVRKAHDHGVAIGQKNAAELSERGRRIGFDFAVAEECAQFDECDSYSDVYGDHVLDIEYTDTLDVDFRQVCGRSDIPHVILRDRRLVAAGNPEYFYRRC
ncbi:endo alpha-1,4 polygalactosaminidase [Nocardia sp. NBC_01377]